MEPGSETSEKCTLPHATRTQGTENPRSHDVVSTLALGHPGPGQFVFLQFVLVGVQIGFVSPQVLSFDDS